MWEVVAVVVLSTFIATLVAVVLLRAHAPDGGYRAWVAEAFTAVRDTGGPGWGLSEDEGEELLVQDLAALAEQGNGYEEAPDLREMLRRHRSRD
ncbi:hypothetical protein [Pseudactinotalea sp. Z1748]|uniref:hypothetical protein n=1 Tax=Pseudactinotalea sp. Z1748 TaxID=3413027 RepID=UPI003C7E8FAF